VHPNNAILSMSGIPAVSNYNEYRRKEEEDKEISYQNV
jgi:hypothetical protein